MGQVEKNEFTAYSTQERGAAHAEREILKEEIQKKVVKQGLETAAIFLAGSSLVSLALLKGKGPPRLVSAYQRVRPAYKIFGVAIVTTLAFFTKTDIAAKEIDREFQSKYSISQPKILPSSNQGFDIDQPLSLTQDGIKAAFIRNRYSLIVGIWLASLIGSAAYNFRNKHTPFNQKIINMRMTAQTTTLFGMFGLAGASALNVDEKKHAVEVDW